MFNKDEILAEHPDRQYSRKLKFVRDAADGDLDKGKWKLIGKQPSKSKQTTGMTDQYLIRFERETEHSFQESLILSHCFQYTKTVLDAYLALFAGVKKEVTWKNASAEVQAYYEKNFDGEGTTLNDWLNDWFAEAMITARTPVLASSPEDTERYPYACLIPRENMRNWYTEDGDFKFLTYDSVHTEVSGISIKWTPSIWVLTDEVIAEYEATKEGSRVFVDAANPISKVPVVDAWFFGGKSILSALASLDMNLMNLDREKRKVIRNQAGMNFFVIDEHIKLEKLSEKTLIPNPRDAKIVPQWANYQAGSLTDAFTYADRIVKAIYEISRLRRQKDESESGIAKTIDFTNTKAVLNHISTAMENSFPKIVSLFGEFESNNMTAELKISREFDTTSVEAAIDVLLKELSANLGPTYDAYQKKQYRDTYSKMPADLKKKSDEEIDNYEANRETSAMTALDNLEPSHDHGGNNGQD